MEKNIIAERREAGIDRARAEGVHCGRPQFELGELIAGLWVQGMSYPQIVAELAGRGITAGKTTVYRFKG